MTFSIVVLIVGVAWTVATAIIAGDDLISLDCQRMGSFPSPIGFTQLLGFLGILAVCRPRAHPVASVRHRKLFAKIHLLVVCAVAIFGAEIGYPQGLCKANCTCGLCHQIETQKPRERKDNLNCSRREVAVNSTLGIFASCGDDRDQASCSGNGVQPAEICRVGASSDRASKSVLADPTVKNVDMSSAINVAYQLIRTERADDVIDRDAYGGYSHLKVPPADSFCSENDPELNRLVCPPDWSRDRDMLFILGMQSWLTAVCDNVYRFCDASDRLKMACATTFCCRTCNTIKFVYKCAGESADEAAYLNGLIASLLEGKFVNTRDKLSLIVETMRLTEKQTLKFFETLNWALNTSISLTDVSDFTYASCVSTCEEVQLRERVVRPVLPMSSL